MKNGVGMGRVSFVAWLVVMAVASLLIAVTNKSWGWFAGAIVLAVVAGYARRQLRKEAATQRAGASPGFVVSAIALMLVVMLGLFWLPSYA